MAKKTETTDLCTWFDFNGVRAVPVVGDQRMPHSNRVGKASVLSSQSDEPRLAAYLEGVSVHVPESSPLRTTWERRQGAERGGEARPWAASLTHWLPHVTFEVTRPTR